MGLALSDFAKRGYKNSLAFVESANHPSLKSFYRMGYKDFGIIHTVRLFGKNSSRHSPGCEKFSFRVLPNSILPNPQRAVRQTAVSTGATARGSLANGLNPPSSAATRAIR
jgi:hypothetical protein